MTNPPQTNGSKQLRWPVLTRLIVCVAAVLVLVVPVLYLGFLLVTAQALVFGALGAFERWILERGWGWANIATATGLAAGFATWVWFFRPFWLKPGKKGSTSQVLPGDQPEWFEAIVMAVAQARAPMPAEVRLDCGGEVRLEPAGMVGAVMAGRHRLTVGTAWIGASTEGQLIADLVAVVSQSPRGLAGRSYWILRGTQEWLERAVSQGQERQAGQADVEVVAGIRFPIRRKKRWWHHPLPAKLLVAYLWLTRRPVWLMLQLTRLLASPALRRVTFAGDAAAAQLLGGSEYAQLLNRKAAMRRVDETLCRRLEDGIRDGLLPDNLAQARVRELEKMGADGQAAALKDGPARLRRIMAFSAEPLIVKGGAAACLVRRFAEVCRQLTQMFYQQDLGLAINQFRLVTAAEAAKKSTESGRFNFDILRYFDGLAHPLRPLCGLTEEDQSRPSLTEMRAQIERSREQMKRRGDQARSMQKEWLMAWQRCRDLEMGHALALAGMPLDARQFGLIAHEARLYREEIARQETIMEHSDEALRSIEADFERRLAAALGLLMQAPAHALRTELQALSAELPVWGGAYGVLCARLPALWRLMNNVPAFESLGAEADETAFRHAEADQEGGAVRLSLEYLLPRIRRDLAGLLKGLERVACPLSPAEDLCSWLLKDTSLPAAETAAGIADGRLAAVVAGKFTELYQTTLAWLCKTAEAAETALMETEPAAAVETRRIPELRLGCDFEVPGDSPACVPVAATC